MMNPISIGGYASLPPSKRLKIRAWLERRDLSLDDVFEIRWLGPQTDSRRPTTVVGFYNRDASGAVIAVGALLEPAREYRTYRTHPLR